MRFVSLTNMPEASVQEFVDRHAVPWHCGYGARQTIAFFGAINRNSRIPGYEVMPTLFLIGADGTIRWCDNHERMRHGDPATELRTLEEQIERALARNDRRQTEQ